MRSAYPSEWVSMIERAQAMGVGTYVPGHGFVDSPEILEEELEVFRQAVAQVVEEGRRLHGQGLGLEEAQARADFGELGDWWLSESQASRAIQQVYAELDGTLPPAQGEEDEGEEGGEGGEEHDRGAEGEGESEHGAREGGGEGEHGGEGEGGEGEGEHGAGESDEEHGEEGGHDEEGEESGEYIGSGETWDATRRGARLILSFDAARGAFVGTVENTTQQTLCAIRVEVHLSTGTELGPTERTDIPSGGSADVVLPAQGESFDAWTAHPEMSACGG